MYVFRCVPVYMVSVYVCASFKQFATVHRGELPIIFNANGMNTCACAQCRCERISRMKIDLLQKSIIYPAPGGVLAAEDGEESTYAGDLIKKIGVIRTFAVFALRLVR